MPITHSLIGAARQRSIALAVAFTVLAALPLGAQQVRTAPPPARATQAPVAGALAALGSPPNPKVAVAWDRFYDHAGLHEIARRLATAHPQFIKLGTIGKSTQGREMFLLTVTNHSVGNADRKPAMWIDGNIHANEIQGAEFSLYTAWYLAEMADRVPAVDSLLRNYTLYIVPSINPDGRDHYIHEPNNASSPRTGLAPRDTDGDGKVDEDGLDDLNGDGHITQMRRRSTNGRYFNTTTYNTTGGLRAMSPSLAVEVSDRIRLGVTANILSGSSTYSVRSTPISSGSAPIARTTPVAERDFSGLAMDMGALVRLREGLQLGVHVTLPHDRPFTRDSANVSVPATRAAPLQIAVGAAMQLNAKTALSLDVRHAPWSSAATTVDSSGAAIPSRVGVNDAASVHVGWERDVSDEDKRGTLRLGAFARQTTSVDLNGEGIAAFGASMGKTWFTAGGAFEMGLLLSRSTMWTRTSDSTTTVSIANTDFALSIGYRKLLGKK